MVLRQRDRGIGAGPAPSCRLHVVPAEGCRKAVIFRRGPTRSTRLIAWDMATDTFEPGQWMRRASVYPERASLSPDGEYLLSFIGTFRAPFLTYSVLSRPPFFTALALWPKGDTWGGGGTFIGPRELVLDHDDPEPRVAPGFRWPGDFVVHPIGPATRVRLERWRERHDPWRPREQERDRRSFARRGEAGVTLLATCRASPRFRTSWDFALESRAATLPLPGAQWADFDGNGDLVFSTGGALDRLPGAALAEAVARKTATPFARRLADFTDMHFEAVAAPYATGPVGEDGAGEHEAGGAAFAPRLDRVSKEDRRRRRAARKALAASREP